MPALAELPSPPSPRCSCPASVPGWTPPGTAVSPWCTGTPCPMRCAWCGSARWMPCWSRCIAVLPSRSRRSATWCGSFPAFPPWRWSRSTIRAPPRCCSGSARPASVRWWTSPRPTGWNRLRQVVGQPATRAVARIQAPILAALGEAPPDARLFLEALIRLAPETPTVTALAERLYVRPSTLMSRFARAGLPSPKNYLAAVRLLHAAYLFEAAGLSVADVAYRLEYSSPQSFGRHLRAMLGITARRVPPPVSLRGRAGALRGADDRAVPGNLANLSPRGGEPLAGGHLSRWYLRRSS